MRAEAKRLPEVASLSICMSKWRFQSPCYDPCAAILLAQRTVPGPLVWSCFSAQTGGDRGDVEHDPSRNKQDCLVLCEIQNQIVIETRIDGDIDRGITGPAGPRENKSKKTTSVNWEKLQFLSFSGICRLIDHG